MATVLMIDVKHNSAVLLSHADTLLHFEVLWQVPNAMGRQIIILCVAIEPV